jgi:uncharacterized protein (TIGR03435 family)
VTQTILPRSKSAWLLPFAAALLLSAATAHSQVEHKGPAASIAFAAVPGLAQTSAAPAAVPMPTGAFSFPPSANPVTYSPTLTFDVVSIRETELGTGPFFMGLVAPPHTCEFAINIVTLSTLTGIAYSIGPPFQVVGGPDWMHDRYFHVEGKCDHSVDEALAKLTAAQARLERLHMLQAMLAERFHLKAHWETRTGSVLNLVVAKGGLKMQPTKLPPPVADRPDGSSSAPSNSTTGVQAHGSPQGIEIDVERFNTVAIGSMLGSQLNTPVVDKTGQLLSSAYDFALKFSRDESTTTDPDAYPPLLTAIEEQLGLKLESGKGPVDFLVIDHADLPSEN